MPMKILLSLLLIYHTLFGGRQLHEILPQATKKPLTFKDFQTEKGLRKILVVDELNINPEDELPTWTKDKFNYYINKGETPIGIFDGDNLAAFYIFRLEKTHLYLTILRVLPNYQRKGLGTYILNELAKEALAFPLPKCRLSVEPRNEVALQFYLKNGYYITEYRQNYFGPAYPNIHRFMLEKQLPPSFTPSDP